MMDISVVIYVMLKGLQVKHLNGQSEKRYWTKGCLNFLKPTSVRLSLMDQGVFKLSKTYFWEIILDGPIMSEVKSISYPSTCHTILDFFLSRKKLKLKLPILTYRY